MPLSQFTEEHVPTRLGVASLLLSPDFAPATRPLLFVTPGVLSGLEDFATLRDGLSFFADMCVLRIPIAGDQVEPSYSLADVSAAVGELIEARFADRSVVLLGASSGGAIALGVRARNLARIVAIEPILISEGLWPVIKPLSEYVRNLRSPVATAFADAAVGVSEGRFLPRDHRWALDGLEAPVDVLLSDEPLQPPREVKRYPSLVGAAERRLLAETPGIRLHVVSGGHNLLGHAPKPVMEIVLEACRRAAARLTPERRRVDEALLEATPLTARRVMHWGPDGLAFAEAFRSMSPFSEVTVLGDDAPSPIATGEADVVVLSRCPPPERLAGFAAALRPGGHLIARWAAPSEDLRATLAAQGLALREAVDVAGTGVLRAQRLAAGDTPRPAMLVKTVAYARILMDIRTRLPARGLGSEPDLQVVYQAPPFDLSPLPLDAPKVVILQRSAEKRPESWRPFLARCLRDGWLTVAEYDDYPPLVAEILGLPPEPGRLERFRYAHAVQTATPALVEAFRPYNPETVLFPNAVFDLMPFPEGPRPRRVFYGGVLRGRYAIEVARSLAPAMARHPDVEFVVIGDREVFNALPATRKRYEDYVSFEVYLELMSQCAISLSPIEALPHRDTKSDAKFLDAARAGVMTIASPTIYDRVIEHGVNGFLARDVADWSPLLDQALSDDGLRDRLARNAWDLVRRERMFSNQVAQRRDWYLDLWSRREALNAALIERVPGLTDLMSA